MDPIDLQSNDYYFNLRAHFGYYEPMYRDYHGMNIWREVVSYNPTKFRDKVVFEVGTGPGLFALLAARAGARHVYTWEPSIIATSAIDVIKKNNYQDTITVLQGPIDKIKLNEKVDLVFTTSIGYCLLLDSLIPELLFARDNFLKEGGTVIPSSAEIYLSSCIKSSYDYITKYNWSDVYGFDFSPIEKDETNEACLDCIAYSRIKTDSVLICNLDFTKITVNDLSIISPFTLRSCNDEPFTIDRFILWFKLKFPIPENKPENDQQQIELSTSPYDADTHWYQVSIRIPQEYQENNDNLINKDDTINGTISILHKDNKLRPIMIRIQYSDNLKEPSKIINAVFK